MTLGWLNSIDMNYAPGKNSVLGKREVLNKGIFSEWYNKIEGDSFDVTSAANAFYELVKNESNIDLLMKTRSIVPVLGEGKNGNSKIEGIKVVKEDGSERMIGTSAVIDATQDGDIMAEAGVPYTYGLEDVGNKEAKMAVTLVFRLKNVTPDVWKQIEKRLNGDNDPGTGANEVSAWGYKELSNYPAVNKDRVKMRGLNIGRQNDNTALINALQIFHIDGADPKAREEAFQVGKEEIPHVVDFMKKNYPEFKNVELDETAPELYIRETRHMQESTGLRLPTCWRTKISGIGWLSVLIRWTFKD
ncbi:FAD-dependent oxidoreductase [Paenibacillus larvae]|nr:FAD-dependent oxidoreductase [Paenibacillus larvae]MDT2266060.1 FAD-dependent oxidoreductase [Paenibacillus larvae]